MRKPSYQRRFTRHEVHLAVRFETAADFVTEYAENLSSGGLFLRGAHELDPGTIVDLELSLPGNGSYRVRATVCHILTPEVAAKVGRKPGAGLELVDLPDDFDAAMRGYLMRLGRRRDFLVLVDSDNARELFEAAGYTVELAPRPDELVATVARSDKTVAAVVVSKAVAPYYRVVADAAGADDLLLSYADGLCLRDLLPVVDDRV